jgi:hypothetical protein
MQMRFVSSLLAGFLFLSGCATKKAPEMTPLQIQALQTRDFEEGKGIVFPSVISVFQDLGYTIKNADKDTGLIMAESVAKSDSTSRLFGVSSVSQTSATAFIEEIGRITKVRLNFVTVNNKSYGYGQTDREDTAILDGETYRNAFERIENAVFVRKAN